VATLWVYQGETAVECEVDITVIFMPRSSKDTECVKGMSVEAELRHQPSGLWLAHDDCPPGELERGHTREDEISKGNPRHRASWKLESAKTGAVAIEDLDTLASPRRISDDEPAVWPEVKRIGTQETTSFRTDPDDLRDVSRGGHAIDTLGTTVEDVVVTRLGPLKAGWFAELPHHVGWETAG
jgi:hypothetical protein